MAMNLCSRAFVLRRWSIILVFFLRWPINGRLTADFPGRLTADFPGRLTGPAPCALLLFLYVPAPCALRPAPCALRPAGLGACALRPAGLDPWTVGEQKKTPARGAPGLRA